MSHFTVLVVGDDVDQQLAPFHEYECTGKEDQYVVQVDITQEFLQQYQQYGEGMNLATFAREWYGINQVISEPEDAPPTGSYIRLGSNGLLGAFKYTNPNAKWDWYQVGGRWTGFFKLKPGAAGKLGKPGVFGDPAAPGYADSALKGDIDFEGMRQEAANKAANRYDLFHNVLAGRTITPFEEVLKKHGTGPEATDAARKEYWAQEAVKDLNKHEEFRWASLEEFAVPRDEYVQAASNKAIMTFAFLKDGQWVERGEMGWFACVSNEKDPGQWEQEFNDLIDNLPDDTRLTVVDCHI